MRRRFGRKWERSGSGWGYDRVELALGGANGGWFQGGAVGSSLVAWKGVSEANLGNAANSSALSKKRRKRGGRQGGH